MRTRIGRLLFATAISGGIGIGLSVLAAKLLAYGLWLFLGVPLFMGFAVVAADTWERPRPLRECLWFSQWPFAIVAAGLLIIRIEGVICLAMAAPIAIPMALLGGYFAYRLQRPTATPMIGACLIAGMLFGQHGPQNQQFRVTTSIVVNAPAEVVWKRVVAFPDIAPPRNPLFRTGLAYPTGTSIGGEGIGVSRWCELSTGRVSERVTAWDPPRLLRFSVLSTPPPMKELNPFGEIDAPHLHGFYVSAQGEFILTPLSGNRTRIDGTSWYRHGLEPAQYWRLWSDYVIHRIHMRVFEHVKQLAEDDYAAIFAPSVARR